MNTPTPRTDKLYSDHIQDPLQSIGDLAAIMHNQCERFERDLTAAREELETERMRLAACGVVAMADTKGSRTKAREMLPEYRSASLSDVERRVDECIELREQRNRLAEAIRLTLMENLDLCDGDQCTLKCLKDAIGFDLDSLENDQVEVRRDKTPPQ